MPMSALLRSNLVLTDTVETLCLASVSRRTKISYDTGFSRYCHFLSVNGISWQRTTMPPIDEDLLIYFVAHCFKTLQLQLSTIKLYLCGVRYHFILRKGENPLTTREGLALPRLNLTLQAVKRLQVQSSRTRLPITFDILCKLCNSLVNTGFSTFFRVTLHTAFSVAFYGFLRCGEFAVSNTFDANSNLCYGDIVLNTDAKCAYLTLKASKTDPGRRGVTITLFQIGLPVCPFSALQRYMAIRFQQSAQPRDPLFVDDKLAPLSRYAFINALRTTLTVANVDATLYSGHSFRSGAATSAASAHIEDHLIKTLGRWTSDAYTRYIKTPSSSIYQAQRAMSKL